MKKLLVFLSLLFIGCGGAKHEDIYIGSPPVKLYLVNQSSLSPGKIPGFVEAFNHQLQNEFKNAWTVDAELLWQDPPDPKYRTVIIKENFSEFPDAWHKALGFHKIGTLAFVDFQECGDDSLLCLAISHEILEMLTNPNVERTGYECCDPVYPVKYAYSYNGMSLTDFVYPSFYNPLAPGPYDQTGNVKASLQPAPGGVLFATLQSLLKLGTWSKSIKPKT